MEQTDNIEALMERIKEQETMYEFDRIDEELALQMASTWFAAHVKWASLSQRVSR